MKISIDWPRLFSSEPFRLGFDHVRGNVPPDDRAGSDPLYQIGRLAAIESVSVPLPDPAPALTSSMAYLLSRCPEMRQEMLLSGARFFASIKKENVS